MSAPFIVFEGVDGSGKTTACKMFTDILVNKKISVYSTTEPTGYEVGKIIRRYLSGESHDPKELLFLFVADRCRHNVFIEKTINENSVVVCDRYSLSTRIYQDEVVSEDLIRVLCNNKDFNLTPDLLVFIDADRNIIFNRIQNRGKHKDIFENTKESICVHERYISKIRFGWKSYGKRLEIISSDCSLEDMNEKMKFVIDKHWNLFKEFAKSE